MKKQYLLRIPKNIKENLQKYGDEKGVSLNAVILSAIDDYIEKKGLSNYGQHRKRYPNILFRTQQNPNDGDW